MAEETLHFFDREFDLDIVKIMPDLPYPFPRGGVRTPEDWLLIDQLELELGQAIGRPRLKFSKVEQMLDALQERKRSKVANPAS